MFSSSIRNTLLGGATLLVLLLLWQCKSTQSSGQQFQFNCALPTSMDTLTNDCESNYQCTIEARIESAIQVSTNQSVINNLSVVPGKQIVFIIERVYKDHPAIADDEFAESIHFSIDAKLQSFSFDSSNLIRSGLTYGIRAYSRDRGYHVIDKGCLEGYLAKDGWHVQLHIDQVLRTGTNVKKSLNAVFKYSQ